MPKIIDREAALPLIYAEVASGRSLVAVLSDEGMPAATTFWRWHMEDPAIRDNLARARENGVEALLEEAKHIADTQEIGETVTETEDGTTVKREDMLGHRKLKIETRIKLAQMLAPRKYRPGIDLTTGGQPFDLAAIVAQRRQQAIGGSDGDES